MFCYVAYGEKLIKKLSKESRNLMMTPEWEELFGKEMDPGDKSVLNYHLISGGVRSGLTAGTISSALLGVDAGIPGLDGFTGALLLDDINSPEVTTSVHEQIETPDIYQRKLATRRRTPVVPTICIQQRIHPNDFSGWVLKNEAEDWETVIIPALDENGESFYPKRYPKEQLEKEQRRNPFMFAAMYQQAPIDNYGAYFHEEWIRTYRQNPEAFDKIFITTDFGFTSDGDKSLFCCWGYAKDKNLYLLRSRQGKWESPDAKRYCIEFFQHCAAAYRQCRRVYVEQTLSGIGFIQDMRRECPAMAIVPLKRGAKKNKLNRAESAMTWMEAGRVYFREADPNFVPMRAELLSYNPSDKNPTDEWCFVAGTKVMTAWGEKNIEDIKVGDKLWTPIGVTRVLKTGHRIKPVITNLGLTGTEDHKIWNPLHFRFDNLGDACCFKPRLVQRSVRWQTLKSYLKVNGISLTKRQDIISSTTKITKSEMGKCFIGLFGNIIRGRRYLKATLFTILTATGATTTILTLCVFHLLNTLKSTVGAIRKKNGLKNILTRLATLLKNRGRGTKRLKDGCTVALSTKGESTTQQFVKDAGKPLEPRRDTNTARNASKSSGVAQKDVVYSLKTGNGVYVANHYLVSNCDNIGDACELAFNNKTSSIFV